MKRWKLAWFRDDLGALLELLRDGKIKPMVAERMPLTEARRAQELLGQGGVKGKLVLMAASR
ncbi:NADPH:quinone reductase-like Zn-dependent oxidoreductase [Rhizobium pisi]|uniref:NADPH:quinone reductase-like Zn-dependent oxidoreductase n=1 Tax=Rhizobium pisi TaxID=574561 RepID=A0A7W5BN25_9HYPH|nr:zinc-binding dehydrogenase [Rhizobium pisi]MBB3135927.1 NADPH:quinone reductase-like Zn-dependent oxidoreductase [Rhizobium pisi]